MKSLQKAGVVVLSAGCIVLCCFSVKYCSQPKARAKQALKHFFSACMAGDTENILHYSVTEQLAPLYETYTEADGYKTSDAEEFAETLVQNAAEMDRYEIVSCRDCTQEMKDQIEVLRLNAEKERKILEKHDLEPDPEAEAAMTKYIGYLDSVETAYSFTVRVKTDGEWETDTVDVPVVRISGAWKADPVSPCILVPAIRDPDAPEDAE